MSELPSARKIELYNKVNQVCRQLEAQGITPSNQKVRPLTGGEAKTVGEYVRQWKEAKEKHQAARQRQLTLERAEAQPIIQALEAYFLQIANDVEQTFQSELRGYEEGFEALQGLLALTEEEVAQLHTANQTLSEAKAQLWQENQALKATNTAIQQQEGQLREDIETWREQASHWQAELAEWKTRYQQLTEETKELKGRCDALTDRRSLPPDTPTQS